MIIKGNYYEKAPLLESDEFNNLLFLNNHSISLGFFFFNNNIKKIYYNN
jgi:hypothetical protein